MKRGRLVWIPLLLVVLGAALSAFAHHGRVEYDNNKTISLMGTVTKFEWTNPHCILTVSVMTDDGKTQEWYAEILPPSQMSRAGWTKESVKIGDVVTLAGHPGKKGAHIMWLQYLMTPDGQKLDRNLNEH